MKRACLAVSVPLLLAGCLTVNVMVTFPAAAFQAAADQIVSEVQESPEGTNSRADGFEGLVLYASASPVLYAAAGESASIDINISNAEIEAIKAQMKERFPAIKSLKDAGAAGENLRGYIEIRAEGLSSFSLEQKGEAKRTVAAENSDRKDLYLALLKANDIPPDRLSEVERIFARSWYKLAQDSWYVRRSPDFWYTKAEWQKEEDEKAKAKGN
ncbi:MAG: DUF1318 domain-containing protein [Planctomycetota bacterium]